VRDVTTAALGLIAATILLSAGSQLLTGQWTAWFKVLHGGWLFVGLALVLLILALRALIRFLFPADSGSSVPVAFATRGIPFSAPVAQYEGSFQGVTW